MKIFLDTADTAAIDKHFKTGLIDGITTNPTLIMKSGRNPEDVYRELQVMGLQDISMEVVGDADEMIAEGKRLAELFGKQATIKVSTKAHEVLKQAKKLTGKPICRIIDDLLKAEYKGMYK